MALTEDAVRLAAHAIAQARRTKTRVLLPPDQRPADAADAYAIQQAVTSLLTAGMPHGVRGWKVGAPDLATEPSASPILELIASPASIDPARLAMIGVEAEIAVVFATDLPPRASAYSGDEVLAAVDRVVAAIEVCDTRLQDWKEAPDPLRLADHQLNFALVTGSGVPATSRFDFAGQTMSMRVDGTVVKEGRGCHSVGNPLLLLPWIANHAARTGGIRRGDAVTTGSWLGMHYVEPGVSIEVEFPGIGAANVTFRK
jgi:2-keto-4-pentenoate hydratase